MEQFEEFLNSLSDSDREWWPFLFLRPQQNERIGSFRALALSVLYGAPIGLLATIVLALAGHRVNPAALPLCLTGSLFVFYRLTFAHAWNRRAERVAPAYARRRID